jgi:mannose-6-phosphate isomerase-like protein (cupin superfamily)
LLAELAEAQDRRPITDAHALGAPGEPREEFFTVDYRDLHIVKPGCGIGLHRHRDNQEVFLLMEGRAVMVVGDWCRMPNRERCLELRTLTAGHMAPVKGGNLHALVSPTDAYVSLFMFGGYD